MTSNTTQPASTLLDDVKSGFLVFLIALPLCLGIAMASGFPPIAGIITASIGGIIVSWLGSARLTIKGPAAGLIVIALGAVQELGQGDPTAGYRKALAVGTVAAAIQIVFALTRTATVGIAMSPAVVHGMLAAIGVIIMSKQVHTALGVTPTAKEPLKLLAEIPHSVMHANPEVLALGLGSLVILFLHPLIKVKALRAIPAAAFVLAYAVPLGLYFDMDHVHDYHVWTQTFHMGPQYLVTLPSSLASAIALPDFSEVLSMTSIKYIVMFALVGSIESVLSVLAVDSLDPEKRPSNLNRDLLATGVGNLLAASVGGLPMISEIVRSKANIDAGAKSVRSNFSHGLFLAIAVAFFPGILHHIPLAALAAMLVYTGSRLASPHEFVHAKKIGTDQLVIFLTTLLLTLMTDLLVGVGAGLVVKIALHWVRGATLPTLWRSKLEVSRHGADEETLRLTLHGAAAFSSLLSVQRAVQDLPDAVQTVELDLTDVVIVDHTFLSRVHAMADEWKSAKLVLVDLESMTPSSAHPTATRRRLA